jgi:hypothetical protein
MKFRSCVLWSCMLVVPMLAMFSHRIPPGTREAIRTHLWQPAAAGVTRVVSQVMGMTTTQPPAEVAVLPTPAVPTLAPAFPTPTAAEQPQPPAVPVAAAAPSVPPPQAPGADPASPPAFAPPPVSAPRPEPQAGVTTPTTTADAGSDRRRSIEMSLAKLGAVAIRCEPLAGHEGMHVGSCHVAIDSSGQLQRVFQAAGADPDTALEHLLDEVTAWRGRAAVRQAGDMPAARNGGAIRL